MGIDNSSSDCIWLYLTGKKLDSETRRQWELHLKRDEEQTMGELRKFWEDGARAHEFSKSSGLSDNFKYTWKKCGNSMLRNVGKNLLWV